MSIHGLGTVSDVAKLISAGRVLLVAGDESLLSLLPKGNWVGGTAAYFMTSDGGRTDCHHIFYTDITEYADKVEVRSFSAQELPEIAKGYPNNGFTVLIVPGRSEIHGTYAKKVHTYDDVHKAQLVGWISGVHVSEIGVRAPKTYAGSSAALENKAAVMYVTLRKGLTARLHILNMFTQGSGAVFEFGSDGFSTEGNCFIDGKPANLAAYVAENKLDTKLPLVADYNGAMANVSFQAVDAGKGSVQFYAPVFRGVRYRLAAPVADYKSRFGLVLDEINETNIAFSCNCILNFLYARLEGRKTGSIVGPITFGEIACMLLNQTSVYLSIEKKP